MEPKYKIISNDLIEKINSGIFKKGDKFYSESQLKSIYNVSSTTAVKVMETLVNLGKIERFQGKGTYVNKLNHNELLQVSDIPLRNKLIRNIKVLSVKKKSDSEIQKKLNITGFYYEIIRIYFVGDDIISDVNLSYIPEYYVNKKHLNKIQDFYSIYELYKSDFNINAYVLPFTQRNTITTLPSHFLINSFDKSKKSNYCFLQERTTYLNDGSILEFIKDYKNTEFFYQILSRGNFNS